MPPAIMGAHEVAYRFTALKSAQAIVESKKVEK